jgi:transcriptional regulator
VVHIYGTVHITDDRTALRARIAQLTRTFEASRPAPWQPDFEGRHDAALNGITGFSIEVTEVQGKFKLSQNRGAEDRRRVAQEFDSTGSPGEAALARLMRQTDAR